jgi:hypothetical protein
MSALEQLASAQGRRDEEPNRIGLTPARRPMLKPAQAKRLDRLIKAIDMN